MGPPKIAALLLRRLALDDDRQAILGDLNEMYERLADDRGLFYAWVWYWMQFFISTPPLVIHYFFWRAIMFANYFKAGLRNLLKHKIFSLINIFGLTLGIASTMLILLWIQDELSFDRHNENSAEIYRVIKHDTGVENGETSALTSPPYEAALKSEFPEIEMTTRIGSWGVWTVQYQEKKFIERGYETADIDYFKIFTHKFIKGDPATALDDLYSVVITKDIAEKYFGNDDPIGESLTISNKFSVTVTGVIENFPTNSSIKFDLLSPFPILFKEELQEGDNENWGFNAFTTFVKTSKGISLEDLNNKLADLPAFDEKVEDSVIFLQPFLDIHLRSDLDHDIEGRGNIQDVWIFSFLALFIISIACINFINLSTARAGIRAKEVGVRKVVGANRCNIIAQFFSESILMSLFALIFSFIIVIAALPSFNNLTGKLISTDFANLSSLIIGLSVIALSTGIISGIYPAFIISSFQPVRVLKGLLQSDRQSSLFRKTLVLVQFSLSILLMICSMVIADQLDYFRNSDLGFNREKMVYIRMLGDTNSHYELLKSEIKQLQGVENISASLALPVNNGNSPGSPEWEGKQPEDNVRVNINFVDYDFMETMKIGLAQGRYISRDFTKDDSSGYMINEEAARQMKLDEPLGKSIGIWGSTGTIVGVVKDYHFQPMRKEIAPIIFTIFTDWFRYLHIRIDGNDTQATLTAIEDKWSEIVPDYPFEYKFLDETYEAQFRAEQRLGEIVKYFSFFAVFIASLGLFGLASFFVERRTKEIGVRKILGAGTGSIITELTRDFVKWIIISNIIAWPLAWIFMSKWLENFAYHTELKLSIFVISGVAALVLAVLTVSFQTVKAAYRNPVDSLRSE